MILREYNGMHGGHVPCGVTAVIRAGLCSLTAWKLALAAGFYWNAVSRSCRFVLGGPSERSLIVNGQINHRREKKASEIGLRGQGREKISDP